MTHDDVPPGYVLLALLLLLPAGEELGPDELLLGAGFRSVSLERVLGDIAALHVAIR